MKLINEGAHLKPEGLVKILAIKAAMNKGLSSQLKKVFPNIVPVKRPLVLNQKIENSQWLAGFTSGEGSFDVSEKEIYLFFV